MLLYTAHKKYNLHHLNYYQMLLKHNFQILFLHSQLLQFFVHFYMLLHLSLIHISITSSIFSPPVFLVNSKTEIFGTLKVPIAKPIRAKTTIRIIPTIPNPTNDNIRLNTNPNKAPPAVYNRLFVVKMNRILPFTFCISR